ncbi:hypothetical protein [Arthrobacter sp. ISL-95]|uniref:hypothetical protein n=1 Tax=Arthrobacter sp. ISL-95 TaxID=2819116 RepID=UPI001BEC2270|nr:hypothetical protein [Arthrobacter sp. ISL-95]MBT2588446.1 hypothetical protein [Arthrobacter sp. ISL-95]
MPSRLVPAWGAEERALAVLTALGIQDAPEQLLNIDAELLPETMSKTQSSDPGAAHGVDNEVIAIVDDRKQPNGVLADHPMTVLESGRRRDVDILFISTTHETGWWVPHRTEDFDPGSTESLVEEFATRNLIPAYDVDGRTPVEVRGALLTDFSFTLPQARGALAHPAAGGSAHLLAVGSVEGAHAVHGTEMYGIVGQIRRDASGEQVLRDTFDRDALLALASGNSDELREPVTTIPTT